MGATDCCAAGIQGTSDPVLAQTVIGIVEAGSIERITSIKGAGDVIVTEAIARDVDTTICISTCILRTEFAVITGKSGWGIGATK